MFQSLFVDKYSVSSKVKFISCNYYYFVKYFFNGFEINFCNQAKLKFNSIVQFCWQI